MYYRVTYDSIQDIKNKWAKFRDDCNKEIDNQLLLDLDDAKNEYKDELRENTYTKESIEEWYDERKSYLNDWASNFHNRVETNYWKGLTTIEELENKRFYDEDFGWLYILDLIDMKIEKQIYNENKFAVSYYTIKQNIDDTLIECDPFIIELEEMECI